jgi:hypothetical protein
MFVADSDDMYLWHNQGDCPWIADGWVISPEMRTEEECILAHAEGTAEAGPPEHGWRLLPATSTTLMSCELISDVVQADGVYYEGVEQPHTPPYPPPGKGKKNNKGKGKTGIEKGGKQTVKGYEKGDKQSIKGDKGKTKGMEKGGKQSTKGDKGIEKGGKQSANGERPPLVIHRGGWFSKCQRISLAVLSADHDASMALAQEFDSGPEEW